MDTILLLEDGKIYKGKSFGSIGTKAGEVVFTTAMSGYQEILTDPSFAGQIVVMTYPHIGNYGLNEEDNESDKVYLEGLIVRDASKIFSNRRGKLNLDQFLKNHNVIGAMEMDTRSLTKHIREYGSMKGILCSEGKSINELMELLNSCPSMIGRDLTSFVSTKESYIFNENLHKFSTDSKPIWAVNDSLSPKKKILIYDFGVKKNIMRYLASLNCSIKVVPYNTKAVEACEMKPDGIVLSNGPGDPAACSSIIEEIKKLIGKVPLLGICLGHQLLALALGGKTFKLKYGHRGANHPVKNLLTHKVEITSQNHGFSVDESSLKKSEVEITHISLNDGTVEGFRHKYYPIVAIQYHPEASPGPHDANYIFWEWIYGK